MATAHAHLPLPKRTRRPSICSRLVGIALGCGIGTHLIAYSAPQLGAAVLEADGASEAPRSARLDAPSSANVAAPSLANIDAPASASDRVRTEPAVGCGPKGVT